MKITLKSILSDALRVKNRLTREETWKIGEGYGYIQSTIDRIFRKKDGSSIPCIKLNSKGVEAKHGDFVYAYKWNGGKTKFKTDYEKQGRTKTGKTKLEKESKNKRKNVRNRKIRVDGRKKTTTGGKNETNK